MSKSISAFLMGMSFVFALVCNVSVAMADNGTGSGQEADAQPTAVASPSPVPYSSLSPAPALTEQDASLSLSVSYQNDGKTVLNQDVFTRSPEDNLVSTQVYSIPHGESVSLDIDFESPHAMAVNLDYLWKNSILACGMKPLRMIPIFIPVETKGLKIVSGKLIYSVRFTIPSFFSENCTKEKFYILVNLSRSKQEQARTVVVRFEYK